MVGGVRHDEDGERHRPFPGGVGPFVPGLVAVAVTTAGFVWALAFDLAITPDGVYYLELAERWARSGTWHLDQPSSGWLSPTHFPPGWSFLVGTVSLLPGVGVGAAARVVQLVAAVAVVLMLLRALAPGRLPGWVAAAVTLWMVTLVAFFSTVTSVFTEPLFLAFAIGAIVQSESARRTTSLRPLVAATALAAGAILVRYVGVALLVPLATAAVSGQAAWRARWTRLAVVVGGALGPTVLWVLTAPTATGDGVHLTAAEQRFGGDEVERSLQALVRTIVSWDVSWSLTGYALLVVVLSLAVIVVLVADPQGPRPLSTWSLRDPATSAWLEFSAAYGAIIVVQRWWIAREIIGRYWLPIIICVGVAVVRAADARASHESQGTDRAARAARGAVVLCAALVACTMPFHLARSIERADALREHSVGLATPARDDSTIFELLRREQSLHIYTDHPTMTIYHTGSGRVHDLLRDRVHDRGCSEMALPEPDAGIAVLIAERCLAQDGAGRVEAAWGVAPTIAEDGVGVLFLGAAQEGTA